MKTKAPVLDTIAEHLPDLSKFIPDRYKPYAKFIVALVIVVIPVLVSQTWITDGQAQQIIAYVTVLAGAAGVLGTTNADPETIDGTGREVALEVEDPDEAIR